MRVVTITILAILVLVYLSPINFYDTGLELFDYQIRAFYHANMTHLLANSISFLVLSTMEDSLGWKNYLFMIIFIWLTSSTILYLIHIVFPSRKVYTVGFSGVIFGMIVVYFTMLGANTGLAIGGLLISILPQLFIPGVSFEGHLAGIVAGLFYVLLFPTDKKLTSRILPKLDSSNALPVSFVPA